MPHDKAIFHPESEVFTPSIFIDLPAACAQFDLDFLEDKREHGFMVSCTGQTLFRNVHLKDSATKLHAQP